MEHAISRRAIGSLCDWGMKVMKSEVLSIGAGQHNSGAANGPRHAVVPGPVSIEIRLSWRYTILKNGLHHHLCKSHILLLRLRGDMLEGHYGRRDQNEPSRHIMKNNVMIPERKEDLSASLVALPKV